MSYYVTVQDNGRSGFLAGPFRTHGDALRMVEPTRKAAREVDDRAHWYAFGTARIKTGHERAGRLNERLGIALDRSGYVSTDR